MIGSKRIRSELELDAVVIVPPGADIVNIEVVSFIHNDSDDHWAVGGTGEHAWQVIDEKQAVIYREAADEGPASADGVHAHGGKLIPARLFVREAETLEVPANKLKNGKTYTVRHLHWGHAAEGQFVVVHEPKKAARKSAKKASKKTVKKAAKKIRQEGCQERLGSRAASRRPRKLLGRAASRDGSCRRCGPGEPADERSRNWSGASNPEDTREPALPSRMARHGAGSLPRASSHGRRSALHRARQRLGHGHAPTDFLRV